MRRCDHDHRGRFLFGREKTQAPLAWLSFGFYFRGLFCFCGKVGESIENFESFTKEKYALLRKRMFYLLKIHLQLKLV